MIPRSTRKTCPKQTQGLHPHDMELYKGTQPLSTCVLEVWRFGLRKTEVQNKLDHALLVHSCPVVLGKASQCSWLFRTVHVVSWGLSMVNPSLPVVRSQDSIWLCPCQNQTCPHHSSSTIEVYTSVPLNYSRRECGLNLLCLLASALHLPGTAHAGVTSTQGYAVIGNSTV